MTNTNIEQLPPQPLIKPKFDQKNTLHRLVTFEANASKPDLKHDTNFKYQVSPDEYILNDPPKKNFSRKKYEQLIKNLSFIKQDENDADQKYNYNYFGIMPFVFFFKYLAASNISNESEDCLKLNLPDTMIINEEDFPPIWLYTSSFCEQVHLEAKWEKSGMDDY